MKFRSLLSSTCSSATCIATSDSSAVATLSPPPKSLFSDTSISSNSANYSDSTTTTSIQSNLSLLTLPSLPSLQTLPPSSSAAKTAAASTSLLTCLGPHHRAHVHFLALHNQLLYAASGDRISVYETLTNTLLDTFAAAGGGGAAKSIAFRGCRIFTAHQDCKIRVWKLTDQKRHHLTATLPTLDDRLRRLLLPHNYVKVRRHHHRLWIQHHDAVSALTTAANGRSLLTSTSWDRSIKVWNTQSLHCLQSINKAHDDAINAVAISDDGAWIYTGSADRKIKVWGRQCNDHGACAYAPVTTLEKHKSAVNALALNRDGSVLYSGSNDRSILVWEREGSAAHMAVVGALRGHARAILCLINARDLLISGSADRTVRIWRRGLGEGFCCLAVLEGHRAPVRSLAAADGGGVKVFSGSFDGEIRVWEVDVSGVDGSLNFIS